MSELQKLTKAEEEIMRLLWKQSEPVTVSYLIKSMVPRPPHSTVSTFIRILEKKGFVGHKTYGRTHAYYPLVEQKVYTRSDLSGIVAKYFKGSMKELVSFMVKENDLSIKDLNDIISQIDEEN